MDAEWTSFTTLRPTQFLELRERARKQLGAKFDIKAFHDEMLSGGSLPLDLLERVRISGSGKQKGGK